VHQVGHLQELYRDVRSAKHNIFYSVFSLKFADQFRIFSKIIRRYRPHYLSTYLRRWVYLSHQVKCPLSWDMASRRSLFGFGRFESKFWFSKRWK